MENEILHEILAEIKGMNVRLDRLEAGQANLEADVCEMKTEVAEIKVTTEEAYKLAQKTNERVDEISVSVMNTELVGIPQVRASIDGYLMNSEKIANHEIRIDYLEGEAIKHKIIIRELKKAL